MKNYLTLEQAKEKGFVLEGYFEKELNGTLKKLENFKPFCKIVPLVRISNYDNKIHFEHITVYLEYKGVLMRPSNYRNEKSFIFFLGQSINIKYFQTNLSEPNRVGKPTEKKLNDWLEYLLEVEKQKQEEVDKREQIKTDFFKKIKESGMIISHSNSDNSVGYIETDLLEYRYEISDNGHIYETLKVRGTQNFDNFLKLAK